MNAHIALIALLSQTVSSADPIDFESQIWPILERSCVNCHRAPYEENGRLKKPKAGFRMDGAWAILLGGSDGPVLFPGDAKNSALHERVILPEDDDDFMPPKGEKLTVDEKQLLKDWIDQGAEFGSWEGSLEGKPADLATLEKRIPKKSPTFLMYDSLAEGVSGVSGATLENIRETSKARIQEIGLSSPLLEVDFRRIKEDANDASVAALEPLVTNITHLDLSKTDITDAALSILQKMPRLTHLNLSQTAISDKGLAQIHDLPHLKSLNLYGTNVTNAGVKTLGNLPELKKIYLWQTKASEALIPEVKKSHPGLELIF